LIEEDNHLVHSITENIRASCHLNIRRGKLTELFILAINSIRFRNCILYGVISGILNIPVRIAERLMMIDSLKRENEPEHF